MANAMMDVGISTVKPIQRVDVAAVAALIRDTQLESGEIPWHTGGKTDPWDHVEAAMGLGVAGHIQEARRAFAWLKACQLEDGSWYAAYRDGRPEDRTRDANQSAYIAVGVYHHYLLTEDLGFLEACWPTVARAMDFALGLQAAGGEIQWAISPEGRVDPMALLTGSSSVLMSVRCALATAEQLGIRRRDWQAAAARLAYAIRCERHRFNVTKSRFSMDWFYPVLCGALTGADARRRIEKYWGKFVVKGQGVKCVADEPWITIAETSELCLALTAMDNGSAAGAVFSWIADKRFEDGTYWCGHTVPDMTVWPEEKITWTNAVVLLAADALFDLTPAGRIFNHRFWRSAIDR
jgi:hypothetical protein